MFKIFDFSKKNKNNFDSKKIYVYEYKKFVHLITVDAKTQKITQTAQSENGFIFKKYHFIPRDIKIYPKIKERFRNFLYNRYFDQLVPASETIDQNQLMIQNAFSIPEGVLVFYQYHHHHHYEIGVTAFSKGDNPQVIWRHSEPVWEMDDQIADKTLDFVDLVEINNRYIAYWFAPGEAIWATAYPHYRVSHQIKVRKLAQLHRPKLNPVIAPNQRHNWESFTTFNPAALYDAGKVHLFYRAQGHDYVSSIGYATSTDGLTVQQRFPQPIFIPTQPFESTAKPGKVNMAFVSAGCGGCEDPRITRLGNKIYMTYVAFNGYSEPRIALTSISVKNFLNHNWLWTHPVLISRPGVVTKSACILPEKINNQYVIFHRIFPNIMIDFVDNLEFTDGQYLKGEHKISPRSALWWDSRKIGVGAPPLKTKDGWLLIYQAVDDKEGHPYKVGAMLLDLADPTQVLRRSRQPILEPQEWYENDGFKAGVVYPCGAVIIDETLFVYYGGADSYVCVATANLDQFLEQLKTTGDARLEPTILGYQKTKVNFNQTNKFLKYI